MSTYVDEPKKAPTRCPYCGGDLVTKWHPAIQHRHRLGHYVMAVPSHTCESCKIAVQVRPIPRGRKLYSTRREARAGGAREAKRRENMMIQRRGAPWSVR